MSKFSANNHLLDIEGIYRFLLILPFFSMQNTWQGSSCHLKYSKYLFSFINGHFSRNRTIIYFAISYYINILWTLMFNAHNLHWALHNTRYIHILETEHKQLFYLISRFKQSVHLTWDNAAVNRLMFFPMLNFNFNM